MALKSNKTTLKSCHLFLQVELSFRTFSNDGLLVYGGSGGSGTDYFSIKLEDGHLVFEYELGGGPVVLKSAARYLCTYHHGCCICFSSSSHKVRICLEEGLQIGLLAIGTWLAPFCDSAPSRESVKRTGITALLGTDGSHFL